MKHTKQRLTRLFTTVASFTLAWFLFEVAGAWSHPQSLAQFFCFAFCVFGIDRVMSAAIDLLTIALAPIETIENHR